MFKVVVVATDGSDPGDLAMGFAKSLAIDQSARVVYVDELVPGHGGAHQAQALEPEIKSKIDAQVSALKAEGLDVEFQIHQVKVSGPPTRSPTRRVPPEPTSSFSAASGVGR
ncbi:MAG: universal stress protein [Candidatus Dormibacteria bacterium]